MTNLILLQRNGRFLIKLITYSNCIRCLQDNKARARDLIPYLIPQQETMAIALSTPALADTMLSLYTRWPKDTLAYTFKQQLLSSYELLTNNFTPNLRQFLHFGQQKQLNAHQNMSHQEFWEELFCFIFELKLSK